MDDDQKRKQKLYDFAEIVVQKIQKKKGLPMLRARTFLASITVISIMGFFFALVFNKYLMGLENKEILMFIVGSLTSILTMIFSYYFRKDDKDE